MSRAEAGRGKEGLLSADYLISLVNKTHGSTQPREASHTTYCFIVQASNIIIIEKIDLRVLFH